MKKTEVELMHEAGKQIKYITVHGAKLAVAPAAAASVLKRYDATTGHRTNYGDKGWLPLNKDWSLHLGREYSKDTVCKAAGLKVFDVAVPHQWQSLPENMKKWKAGEWAVWCYDGKDRMFGRPVWRTEVFRLMVKNVLAAMRQ